MDTAVANELRAMRLSGERRPRRVLSLAPHVLAVYSSSSPVAWLTRATDMDFWDAMEQVMLAALDVYNAPLAKKCFLAMLNAFGKDSNRLKVLRGLYCETFGELASADRCYMDALQSDPTLSLPRMRRVSILLSIGSTSKAVEYLVNYLDSYMTDWLAWQQLGELYVSLMDFPRAKFCYQEVLLNVPQNHHMHVRIAELLYSEGSNASLMEAQKHYCVSLEIHSKGNHRALYGIMMCLLRRHDSSAKRSDKAASGTDDATQRQLAQWACDHMHRLHLRSTHHSDTAPHATIAALLALASSLVEPA